MKITKKYHNIMVKVEMDHKPKKVLHIQIYCKHLNTQIYR